jgi:hypothetical protein
MRWDDLSICTTTSARAGDNANADITIAATNASRPPKPIFMNTPSHHNFL